MTPKKLTDYLKQPTPPYHSGDIEQAKSGSKKIRFEKETEFQETPIGKIPKEWEIATLSQLVTYVKGKKPDKLYREKVKHDMVPYLKAEYLRGLEPPEWCMLTDPNVIIVSSMDILMIWDGSYSGEVFTGFEGALASTMIKMMPKNSMINNKYLYYWLKKHYPILHSTTKGTGIPHVSKSVFENLLIPLPSVEVQKTIAEILYSVDFAIEKVRLLVDRAERLKKGLMQELLTKGIGHREYKETPIGKIPKEWEVVSLDEVSSDIRPGPFGSQLRKKDLVREGVRVYTQENVLKRNFSLGDMYISWEKFKELKSFEVKPRDVLITIRGTVGIAAVFPEDGERGIIHTNLAIVRVKKDMLLPEFLCLLINDSHIVKRQIKELSSATTLGALYAKHLSRIKIPLPSLEEQTALVEIFSILDGYVEISKAKLKRLENVKRGLMEVLLTGKVRVIAESS